ncbi:hypothetical protein ACFL1Q_00605 [Patescibacteria group bacterium]
MKRLCYILLFAIYFLLVVYITLPSPAFPDPPDDSIQSHEPADSEDPLRRAYFTNFNRDEVISHYKSEFSLKFKLPSLVLNYPPEEAQTIIRVQTRSTFLQEIVHPFRESIYINGFEPSSPKDAINIEGRAWRQKIIIRYIPSSLIVRLIATLSTIAVSWLLIKEITKWKK